MKTPLFSTLRKTLALAAQSEKTSVGETLEHWEKHNESRRNFLRTSAQAGLLLHLGNPARLIGAWTKDLDKIAIVGGGLSGLTAGYYLRRKGVKATIYEGDRRIGGRMKSARIFAEGKLNTEIGAEFIDTVHSDMLWLVRMLGLESQIIDVEKDTLPIRELYMVGDQVYTTQQAIEELNGAYRKMRKDQKKMNGKHLERYDNMSMGAYIEQMPISKWTKSMLEAAFVGENGMEVGEQSAANLLYVMETAKNKFQPFGPSDERFKVIGGNEQIPQGLAKILSEQIRYEHKLTAIREKPGGQIQLVFSRGGQTVEETFDAAIITLPLTVLREVDIQMELPEIKKRVIREMGYGMNTKFIMETADRPWRKAGNRGYLFNDKMHNGWDSAQMQLDNNGPGSYTVYFGGKRAAEAKRGTEKEQLEYCSPGLNRIFPGMSKSLTGKMELATWPSNPFVRASYSCYKTGQVSAFEGAAFEPVRNLYFAGEHCSVEYWGFMNGAAETGRKAAEKVLEKLGVQ